MLQPNVHLPKNVVTCRPQRLRVACSVLLVTLVHVWLLLEGIIVMYKEAEKLEGQKMFASKKKKGYRKNNKRNKKNP